MKFTKEFFDTLGTYVYQYADPETDKPYYVGKGKGDRCIQHVRDKGYESAHCRLVAKNLERFSEENPDAIAFAIESFIISQNPTLDNKVSGHYKECFTMPINLDNLFTDYVSSKTTGKQDLLQTLEKYPAFDECLDRFGAPGQWTGSGWSVTSPAKNYRYMVISSDVKVGYCKLRLEEKESEKIKPTKQSHYDLGVKMTKNFANDNIEVIEHVNADDDVLFSSAKTYVEFHLPNLEDAIDTFITFVDR